MVWHFRSSTIEKLHAYIAGELTPWRNGDLIAQVAGCWPDKYLPVMEWDEFGHRGFHTTFMEEVRCTEQGYDDLFVRRKWEDGTPANSNDITRPVMLEALEWFIMRAGDDTRFLRPGDWNRPRLATLRRTGTRALDLQPGVKVD